MKNILSVCLFLSLGFSVIAQNEIIGRAVPDINIKTLEGAVFNTSGITNDGKPIILSFWALWCKPCINEMNAISDVYSDWQAETGVKMVAVSIDDARSAAKVAPTVSGNGWEYEVYSDPNGDFKRAMGVNMIPHLFILDGNRNIVYQHTSYSEGSEYELFEIIKKVAAGEKVESH